MMKKKGFTLIELIVVIIILGALAVFTVPAIMNSGKASKEAIKTSKIESIKVAASNYVEANVNKYSDCNSLKSQDNLANNCIITIGELIEDNYLDKDKNEETNIIKDPTTDEAMAGSVLACYNMNTGNFTVEYYENIDDVELCSQTGVHTLGLQDNSLAISYHDGIDFYTNILALGEYEGILTLSKSEDNGVHFEIVNNTQLHVTYARQTGLFEGDTKTASTTIIGRFNTGSGYEERSVTFNAFIYDEISEEASQLSVTIRPNDKLRELGNLKKDITLTCTQNNEYGCEINLDYFEAYFDKSSIEYYEYVNKYSLGSQMTYKSQSYTGIEQGKTYRLYDTQTAPPGVLSIKNKSVIYVNIVPSTKRLTFDAQNGTVSPSTKTVTYGDAYGSLPTPTRTGYIFRGWYETTGYTKEITAETIVEKITDHIIYAKWEPIKYTIAFNGNGATSGSMSEIANVEYDKSQTLTSNAFERTGYTFSGWKVNNAGDTIVNQTSVKNLTTTNGATVTLYAQWTPVKYTIAFNGNGATSGNMSNITNVEYDKSQTLTTNAFARTGYTFAGWKINNAGDTIVNQTSVKNLTTTNGATVTLYAQWEIVNYTITYNLDGGELESENPTSYNINTDTFTLNNPTKTGLIFKGWLGTDLSDITTTVTINKGSTGNRSYTAQWMIGVYRVTFHTNGGSIYKNQRIDQYIYGIGATLPLLVTKSGFIFKGWYEKSDFSGEPVRVISKTDKGDKRYYAKWTPIKYTISFYGNGSTRGNMSNITNVEYDTEYTLTANAFYKTGYDFAGWKVNNAGDTIVNQAVVKNLTTTDGDTVTLYAQWTPIKYSINFDANGGTGNMNALTNLEYDSTYTLTTNAFSQLGYTFSKWSTRSDIYGTTYSNEAQIKNLATSNGATVTLYAQWEPIKYTIVFDGNGATSGSMENLIVSYGLSATLTPNEYKKTGHKFNGWNTRSDGQGTHYDNGKIIRNLTTKSETITLYAEWELNQVNVMLKFIDESAKISDNNGFEYTKTAEKGGSAEFNFTIVKGSFSNLTLVFSDTLSVNGGYYYFDYPNSRTCTLSDFENGSSVSSSKFVIGNLTQDTYCYVRFTNKSVPTPCKNYNITNKSTGYSYCDTCCRCVGDTCSCDTSSFLLSAYSVQEVTQCSASGGSTTTYPEQVYYYDGCTQKTTNCTAKYSYSQCENGKTYGQLTLTKPSSCTNTSGCENVTVYNNITNQYVTYYGHIESRYCVIYSIEGIGVCGTDNATTIGQQIAENSRYTCSASIGSCASYYNYGTGCNNNCQLGYGSYRIWNGSCSYVWY